MNNFKPYYNLNDTVMWEFIYHTVVINGEISFKTKNIYQTVNIYFCYKVGHFKMEVYGDWSQPQVGLWGTAVFVIIAMASFFSPGGCCFGIKNGDSYWYLDKHALIGQMLMLITCQGLSTLIFSVTQLIVELSAKWPGHTSQVSQPSRVRVCRYYTGLLK